MTPPLSRVETSLFKPDHTLGAVPRLATSSAPTAQVKEAMLACEQLAFHHKPLSTLLRINECFLSLDEDLYANVLDILRAELDSSSGVTLHVLEAIGGEN